jgi:hypothetical protein
MQELCFFFHLEDEKQTHYADREVELICSLMIHNLKLLLKVARTDTYLLTYVIQSLAWRYLDLKWLVEFLEALFKSQWFEYVLKYTCVCLNYYDQVTC